MIEVEQMKKEDRNGDYAMMRFKEFMEVSL